jgi:hypothetical protein
MREIRECYVGLRRGVRMRYKGKAVSYKNPGICLFPFQILIYDSSFIKYVCSGNTPPTPPPVSGL